MKEDQSPGYGTCSVWAGEEEYLMQHVTQVPVVHSVSFGYRDIHQWQQVVLGEQEGHIYSRNTNPTVSVFENKVCRLEGAQAVTSAATGMGIISSTLFALLLPGQKVVSVKDTYGGTNKIFTKFLPRINVTVVLCDTTDHEAIEDEIAKGCDLLYLESHPKIKKVFYPGLPSHEGHLIAKKQMTGFGGMLSFMFKEDTFKSVGIVLKHLKYAHCAANLGAVETIVGPPATTSHVECSKKERLKMGIPESLIRYSAGIENVTDLIDDLDNALSKLT